jgi:hypothetical protein
MKNEKPLARIVALTESEPGKAEDCRERGVRDALVVRS